MSNIILTTDHLNSSRELLLLNAYGKNSGTLTILMIRMFTSLLSSVFLKNRCKRVDTTQIAPWSRSADLISNTNCSSSGLYANTLKTRIALIYHFFFFNLSLCCHRKIAVQSIALWQCFSRKYR